MNRLLATMTDMNFFAAALCVFLALLALACLWDVVGEMLRPVFSSSERLVSCSKCHVSFLTRRFETIMRCPRCGSLCTPQRHR
mgnify:CR=1 FL=1